MGALGTLESRCKLWEVGGDNVGTKRLSEVAIGVLKIGTGEFGESGEQRWHEMMQ